MRSCRRRDDPSTAKWSNLPFHHNSCIGPSLRERNDKAPESSRWNSVVRALDPNHPAKMTKEILAPLPGFGKLITPAISGHTLGVTLRDDTEGTHADEPDARAPRTSRTRHATAHRTSPAALSRKGLFAPLKTSRSASIRLHTVNARGGCRRRANCPSAALSKPFTPRAGLIGDYP